MASERVTKYYDDGKSLISVNSAPKVVSEINKLKTWVVKHQNETINDGSKTKLLSTVELYYRYCVTSIDKTLILEPTYSLLSDYLQLPEGKLLSAKDKKKVLNWLQELSVMNPENTNITNNTSKITITKWSVQSLNSNKTFSILNEEDAEEYRDDFVIADKKVRLQVTAMLKENKLVVLSLDAELNIVDVEELEE